MEHQHTFREKWRHIVFGTDTAAGRTFDKTLIVIILLSVACVMVDSVPSYRISHSTELYIIEWVFTAIFTIEYFFRIYISDTPKRYIFSFYGLVDILSILPSFISLLVPGANYLLIIRLLRVLRVFRVLKLLEYMGEASLLLTALRKARQKITVFLLSVFILATIFGSLMYVLEGSESGFTSIPTSIYWAIVTITTVGYGDISPSTPLGQMLASFVMLLGYAIIAIPTGIVTAEIAMLNREDHQKRQKECPSCHKHNHNSKAKFCDNCGTAIQSNKQEE